MKNLQLVKIQVEVKNQRETSSRPILKGIVVCAEYQEYSPKIGYQKHSNPINFL